MPINVPPTQTQTAAGPCIISLPPGSDVVELGSTYPIRMSFIQPGVGAVDPGVISLTIYPPSGATQGPFTYQDGSIAKNDIGQYEYDVVVNRTGSWAYGVSATTPGGAASGSFQVVDPINA